MNPLEVTAVAFGIVAVFLNARQNPWGWGASLVNVGLFTLIFYRGQLYALMGLQVCFGAISAYGWYHWLRGGTAQRGVGVSAIARPTAAGLGALALVSGALLGWALDRFTPDQQPYLDAGIAVISLAAQWMMARKYVECWVIWVAVNLISVPFFLYRGEYPTALQYSVFLVLAVNGLRSWRRALHAARA
ncbi:MAG: nicotinamide riboside transporter PnuC [Gemmatimonadales bacterium]